MNLLAVLWTPLLLLSSMQNAGTGSVSGTLKLPSGAPAAGIRVAAMMVPEGNTPTNDTVVFVSITETDASGRYQLSNIPPGRYYITAGFVATPTYYRSVPGPGPGSVIQVTAGAALAGYDFTTIASTGVSVRGRVVAAPRIGQLPPQTVMLTTSPVSRTPIRADGSFEFEKVPPGNYTISVTPAGYGTSQGIVVQDRDIDGVQITSPNQIVVSGRIVTEDRSPLPAADLLLSARMQTYSFSTGVPQSGGFTLRLFEGEYQIAVQGFPPGYTLKSIAYGNTRDGLSSLRVGSSPEGEVVLTMAVVPISSIKTVRVSGKVVNVAREWTLTNRVVRLVSSGAAGATLETPLGADHTFTFQNVPAGTYGTRIVGLIERTSFFPTVDVVATDLNNVTIDLPDNPFPEYPGSSIAPVYGDLTNKLTVRGVVTQGVTRLPGLSSSGQFRYFRMDVKDDVTGVVTPWAVMFVRAGDSVKVTVGETVSVSGTGAKDGTNRMTLDSSTNTIGTINGVPVWRPTP